MTDETPQPYCYGCDRRHAGNDCDYRRRNRSERVPMREGRPDMPLEPTVRGFEGADLGAVRSFNAATIFCSATTLTKFFRRRPARTTEVDRVWVKISADDGPARIEFKTKDGQTAELVLSREDMVKLQDALNGACAWSTRVKGETT